MRLQEIRSLYRDKDHAYGNANVHYMLLRVFDTFDIDGNGFLSKDEIYRMKESIGRRSFGRVSLSNQIYLNSRPTQDTAHKEQH